MSTPATDVVAPSRLFRALSGKCAGQVFAEEDVCLCDEQLEGCGGAGRIGHPRHGDVPCPQCDGVGLVLGYPDVGRPVKLALVVEAAPPDRAVA